MTNQPLTEQQKKEQKRRKLQRKVIKDQHDYHIRDHLITKGQTRQLPLVLTHKDDNEPDHVIAVIKDNIEDHWNVGTHGTRTTLVKGKCHRCGCNRLEVSTLEPAGEQIIGCPACNADDAGHPQNCEHTFTIER